MPTISGLNNKDGHIIIVNEADWSVEYSADMTASPFTDYNITVSSGTKLVIFKENTGEIKAYGNVTPTPDAVTWYDVTDGMHWYGNESTWNGSVWTISGGGVFSSQFGWYINIRPTKMRITGVIGSASTITLEDVSNYVIGSASISDVGTEAEVIMNLTFSPSIEGTVDMKYLHLAGFSTVAKIEIDVFAPPAEAS